MQWTLIKLYMSVVLWSYLQRYRCVNLCSMIHAIPDTHVLELTSWSCANLDIYWFADPWTYWILLNECWVIQWNIVGLTWCCHAGTLVLHSPLIGSEQPGKFGTPRLEAQAQHTSWSQSPAPEFWKPATSRKVSSPSHTRLRRGGNPVSDSMQKKYLHSMFTVIA